MSKQQEENFLNIPACPFRRVSFGTANCTISTDNHVSEVDPLTCLNCEVPALISVPRCRYLSIGTELKPYRGEGKLVAALACRALTIKLYSLKTCDVCELYDEVPSLAEILSSKAELAELKFTIDDEVVNQIARDIKLDYGVRSSEDPPLLPIRCWRFPEGYCRKLPIYTQHKTTVVLKASPRNDELYRKAIEPVLKQLHLQPYRIDEELIDDEVMCRVCENVQESDYAVYSLDDWSSGGLLLKGIAYGLGKRLVMLKDESLKPVPLLDHMEHDVVHYQSVESLKSELREALLSYLKPDS